MVERKERVGASQIWAKVADFGLANSRRSSTSSPSRMLPTRWTAPEVLSGQERPSSQSDVWSFGILMFEVFSFGRVLPFEEVATVDLVEHILGGGANALPLLLPAE